MCTSCYLHFPLTSHITCFKPELGVNSTCCSVVIVLQLSIFWQDPYSQFSRNVRSYYYFFFGLLYRVFLVSWFDISIKFSILEPACHFISWSPDVTRYLHKSINYDFICKNSIPDDTSGLDLVCPDFSDCGEPNESSRIYTFWGHTNLSPFSCNTIDTQWSCLTTCFIIIYYSQIQVQHTSMLTFYLDPGYPLHEFSYFTKYFIAYLQSVNDFQ